MSRSRAFAIPLLAAYLCACGGGSAAAPPEGDPVTAQPPPADTVVSPSREPEPEEDPRMRLVWYVFWDEIHCLTVYPQPGPIRSEEPPNSAPPFGTDSPHFSIISRYFEQEDLFGPVLASATSLDGLLDTLRGMELVDVREAVNPVYDE